MAPDTFNAHQQRRIDWSPRPVIARAYLDQLDRSNILAAERRQALADLLDRTDQALSEGTRTDAAVAVAGQLDTAAAALERDSAGAGIGNQRRLRALSETLANLAERLR